MSKYLRYMGEFLSHANVVWRVEILQDADSAFASVGQLTFEAEEALLIEWKNCDKEDVLHGSTATIQIESPGDRTYEDLYTIEVGRIRMDVYRNNILYWSGALDPEFYEEPYERASHYVVSLTFSDFGILGRLKYDLSGMQTLHDILTYSLGKSTILYGELDDTSYCSTYFADNGIKADPSALAVRSEDFFDEDGEPETLEDTIKGILQPLGLHMIQRNGKVYVFDLNGLYLSAPTKAIEWDGDSQTMGVDKVANNVKVNFSPYASSKLLDGELEYNDEYGADWTNLRHINDGVTYQGAEVTNPSVECYSFYPDLATPKQGSNWDYGLINFTIFLSSKGSGLAYVNPSARYFHIQPMVNGPSETTGIAWSFRTGHVANGYATHPGNNSAEATNGAILMRSNRIFIPTLSSSDRKKFYIKLSLEMLLDARYNPFSDAKDNEESNYNAFKSRTGWAFVPIGITLYDKDGNAISHFCNKNKSERSTQGMFYWTVLESVSIAGQEPPVSWQDGAASYGDCWLEYYNTDDQKEDCGILGWHNNRQNIGRPDVGGRQGGETNKVVDYSKGYFGSSKEGFHMYESFKAIPDGEFIPYPENGGWLEVTVYSGVRCYDYGESTDFDTTYRWTKNGYYNKVRWLLYKAPIVQIVKKNLVFDEAELDDVEYSGYINKAAKEEISIDTICGTANKVCPTAKGIYHRASDSLQIQTLKRADVTDHPEKLLIGTLYSQYAERHTTLEGNAVIDAGELHKYTEQNQSGKVFMVSGETQDVIADVTDATYTELSKDEYEAIEEVED